jgi:hypothetical protein
VGDTQKPGFSALADHLETGFLFGISQLSLEHTTETRFLNPHRKPPETPKTPETGFLLRISQLSLEHTTETRFLSPRRPPPETPETGFLLRISKLSFAAKKETRFLNSHRPPRNQVCSVKPPIFSAKTIDKSQNIF